jgi:hypothetical protein
MSRLLFTSLKKFLKKLKKGSKKTKNAECGQVEN